MHHAVDWELNGQLCSQQAPMNFGALQVMTLLWTLMTPADMLLDPPFLACYFMHCSKKHH